MEGNDMWPHKKQSSLAETINKQCEHRAAFVRSLGLEVWRESDHKFCTVTVNGIYGNQVFTHSETLRIIGRSDVDLNARVLWSMDYAAGVVLAMREAAKKRGCKGK